MKIISFIILSILLTFFVFSQQKENRENLKYIVTKDSVFSKIFEEQRYIKVYLPKGYRRDEKYPVLYTLDGDWMFEPTVLETRILSDFEVIPKCIVVGILHQYRSYDLDINWKEGVFKKSSLYFKKFLSTELIPYINSKYTISGFNVLIGHSSGATFAHKVLTTGDQPFRGFICLSQKLFGNQLGEYSDFLKTSRKKEIFYFVASGERDATIRVASGIKLDSIFKLNQNKKIITKHVMFDADHSGVAAEGLKDGLSHVFSEYKHYNGWDKILIDSLIKYKISALTFMEDHIKRIKNIYGLVFKVNEGDVDFMQYIVETDQEMKDVENYEVKHVGKHDHFYSLYAQSYEIIKSYETALKYWKKLTDGDDENTLYYHRPAKLLAEKLDRPKEAIEFLELGLDKYPGGKLVFHFLIAEYASKYNIEKERGLVSIDYVIKNFEKDSVLQFLFNIWGYTLDDAIKIKKNLESK